MRQHYTFGDNDRAVQRLTLLARAFEASSERLLASIAPPLGSTACAVDLGCGPGHTTELLERTVRARHTWGLDASPRLIDRARARSSPGLRFVVHDAGDTPYPVSAVDFAYARYLLNHLAAPERVIAACASALRPGGRLVLEENCALTSEDPALRDYYRRVESLQRHYGQDIYVGEQLARLAEGSALTVERFERTRIDLDPRVMARLHAMNIRTWMDDPFALASFDSLEIDRLTARLDAIADGDPAPPVGCVMGQAVLRRS